MRISVLVVAALLASAASLPAANMTGVVKQLGKDGFVFTQTARTIITNDGRLWSCKEETYYLHLTPDLAAGKAAGFGRLNYTFADLKPGLRVNIRYYLEDGKKPICEAIQVLKPGEE